MTAPAPLDAALVECLIILLRAIAEDIDAAEAAAA